MYPILFQLGDFELRSYGVLFALSFLAAVWLGGREAARKGLDAHLVHDFAFYGFIGGIVGARLYFVLFSDPMYFLAKPWEILAIWHGGISVIGSLIGGFLVAIWFTRKKQVPFLKFADALAPAIPLGQTLGQLACLANGDSYGRPTDLPWAITYTDPHALAPLNVPLHPIEIYEMGAYFLVFLIVWLTRKRFRADGYAFLTYLVAFGAARFFMEFFRGDPAMFAGGVPAAQVFGVAMIVSALIGYVWLRANRSARAQS